MRRRSAPPHRTAAPEKSGEIMIVAIGRELGSGGRAVGERTARLLGAQLLDKEIVDLVAARMGAPKPYVEARDESVESFVDRLLRMITAASPESFAEGAGVPDWSEERLVKLTETIIREHAEGEPLVVIGRGAPVLLRDRSDLFRVFVTASAGTRAARVAARTGKSLEDALRELRSSDQHRSAYMQQYYNVDWRDARLYDLVVNTDRIDYDDAARLIAGACGIARPKSTA
jgi:CMP/dCMP kinase